MDNDKWMPEPMRYECMVKDRGDDAGFEEFHTSEPQAIAESPAASVSRSYQDDVCDLPRRVVRRKRSRVTDGDAQVLGGKRWDSEIQNRIGVGASPADVVRGTCHGGTQTTGKDVQLGHGVIAVIVVAAIGIGIWYFLTQTGDSSVDTPSPVPTSLTVTATPSPTI